MRGCLERRPAGADGTHWFFNAEVYTPVPPRVSGGRARLIPPIAPEHKSRGTGDRINRCSEAALRYRFPVIPGGRRSRAGRDP
ncbi:hypothetical protein CHELA41_22581 [Hyphomicrobiales bacterium]|nr:hypothetical protein CHELA41_22581 [Hyphomicrobiales bacterium]